MSRVLPFSIYSPVIVPGSWEEFRNVCEFKVTIKIIWKLSGRWFALETCTASLHQVILSFLILGSSDLDPSMMLDTGEIIDTGSDYEDQVIKI